MTSRSDMMPAIRPSSTTGSAPIRFSPSRCDRVVTRVPSAVIVSTALPLSRSTAAMVMAVLPDSPLDWLDSPTSRGQREAVPEPDPAPEPAPLDDAPLLADLPAAGAAVDRHRRDRAWCWSPAATGEVHASLIIATALGIGLTVLLGTALMTLVFLSNSSGHDDAATPHIHEESDDQE